MIYGTPILDKSTLIIPFQTSRDPFPDRYSLTPSQNLYRGIRVYPRPRQTLRIGPLLVARPYPHLHSKCPLPGIFAISRIVLLLVLMLFPVWCHEWDVKLPIIAYLHICRRAMVLSIFVCRGVLLIRIIMR